VAQRLVDPVRGDLLQPPDNDRDLIAAARNGHVLAFDNMSRMGRDLSDSFCRLATGAEIGGRALYTNYDSATFTACRPQLWNGIPNVAVRGDLAQRCLAIRLEPIARYIDERTFWKEIEEALPGALAGLLDALVLGLEQFDQTETPNVRMADFAKLIVAAEPKLPWRQGAFMEAYESNRVNLSAATIEGDAVAQRVLAFIELHDGYWSGPATELYKQLSQSFFPEVRGSDWPANAAWLGNRLTRAAVALRDRGVEVTSKHGREGTTVTITKIASQASPSQQIAASRHPEGDDNNGPTAKVASQTEVASPSSPKKSANGDAGDASEAISTVLWGGYGFTADDQVFLDDET
jgi:hypothetical protein